MAGLKFQNRRDFLKFVFGTAFIASGTSLNANNEFVKKDITKITILYTNDVHSRIEAFPLNDPKYPGLGGFASRSQLIKQIRTEEKNVLVLDAGDVFQGTPYFNFYAGELEFKLMSSMGYDCMTLGNHDFDLGIDNIVKQLQHASFNIINCNYNFENTNLKNKIKPYRVIIKDGIRIGILGVGIELTGLVDKKMYQETICENALNKANYFANILKHDEKCDLIICLSHLGYTSENKKLNDQLLAKESENIDLIIGGHTHTFLNEPVFFENKKNKKVMVTQVGWAGVWLGRIDVLVNKNNFNSTIHAHNYSVKKNSL
jgi:5'-nucleotidase